MMRFIETSSPVVSLVDQVYLSSTTFENSRYYVVVDKKITLFNWKIRIELAQKKKESRCNEMNTNPARTSWTIQLCVYK